MSHVNADAIVPGDWVRFYHNGKLVIGVVQYPIYRHSVSKYVDTDQGAVDVEMIREVRKLQAAAPGGGQ